MEIDGRYEKKFCRYSYSNILAGTQYQGLKYSGRINVSHPCKLRYVLGN